MEIPAHFQSVQLHEFVVMPNHVHGIIQIVVGRELRNGGYTGDTEISSNKTNTAQYVAPLQPRHRSRGRLDTGSLSVIIRSFKAVVTRRARAEMHWGSGI